MAANTASRLRCAFHLRPNVSWHDGPPLTASDFVFAWTFTKDSDLPINDRSVANQIERIDAPDDGTLVIEWARPYPLANVITEDDLGPLPAHLLEDVYRNDKARLPTLPYWTREFVGVGPYRLTDWQEGSHLTLQAFDGFYAGPPRIHELTFRFIPNADTIVANLLAGSVDTAISGLEFAGTLRVKRQWEGSGRDPLMIVRMTGWQLLGVQFRDPRPMEVLDVRFRRALLHAIDRQTIADSFFEGFVPVSDTFMPPGDERAEGAQDVVTRYPYDPRRAQELLGEVGWRPGSDGSLVHATGERVPVSLWAVTSEREIVTIADYWKAIGITPEPTLLGQAQTRDGRLRSSFPSFEFTRLPIRLEGLLRRVHTSQCPTEQSHFGGSNRGCYSDPEMDRLIDAIRVAIDPADQRLLWRELLAKQSAELPVLPMYFDADATIFRERISGPRAASPQTAIAWNIETWDVQ